MDRAVIVFQARLKSEYKLFVKTRTWSHTQVKNTHIHVYGCRYFIPLLIMSLSTVVLNSKD